MRVVLTGFMGAGKTTVGRLLASRLEWPFVDLDQEIEARAGRSIREIFAQDGEAAFRQVERELLVEALSHDPVVLAAGGGTLTFPENLEMTRARAMVVWLSPDFATLARRIGGKGKEDRPLFRDEAGALALYRERLPAYSRSDLRIDVAPEERAEEVAARIALRLKETMCST